MFSYSRLVQPTARGLNPACRMPSSGTFILLTIHLAILNKEFSNILHRLQEEYCKWVHFRQIFSVKVASAADSLQLALIDVQAQVI